MSATDQVIASNRYHLIPRTLCFITRGQEVLLLRGAPDKTIWPGKYNGIGGHVERNETVYAAALREMREETGLEVTDVRLRAVVNIDAGEAAGIGLFVFTAGYVGGELRASKEGSPEWVDCDALSELDLVEDLPALLPRVLAMGPDDPPWFARYSYNATGRLATEFQHRSLDSRILRALATICERLKEVADAWAFTAGTNLYLRGLASGCADIDIATTAEGAYRIAAALALKAARPLAFWDSGAMTSHFGTFDLDGLRVDIVGDFRAQRSDGSRFASNPLQIERLAIEGLDLPVPLVALEAEAAAYQAMGRRWKARLLAVAVGVLSV